ncbi:MAG: hydrogenase maturation protease [Rhodocyclaceae bacterium]|nr:hydrogenase maturation protease [Rhodocyclaceae bacterium]
MKHPVLLFALGNPARGDDALGPACLEKMALRRWPHVECRWEYQLQVEHALDLLERTRVIFIDASIEAPAPFRFRPLQPRRETSFITSHALVPEYLLALCQELYAPPPPAYLLAIKGERFSLGAPLSPCAAVNLEAAASFLETWLISETSEGIPYNS